MNLTPKKQLEISFPLLLLLLLSVCAIYIVLYAAGTYESITTSSSINDSARTSAAFIEEQIHQNDTESSEIKVGTLDGCDALIITKEIDGRTYTSYIYCYDGSLREILASPGLSPDKSMGAEVTDLLNLTIEERGGNILQFTCTDKSNRSITKVVCIRS